MRRLTTLLLATVLLSCTCHAETFTSTVFYDAPSEYVVKIPAMIIVDGSDIVLEATRMELRDDEYVTVTLEEDDPIHMQTPDGKKHATARVYGDDHYLGYFRNLETVSETSFYMMQDMVEGAGDYYGSITFRIELRKDGDELTGE